MSQEMVLCIPGPWRDRFEFLKSIISLPPAGEFMFAGEVLAHPKSNDHVQIEFCDQDPQMRNAFQISGQGRLSEETLDLIGQHQSVVYLVLPINALEKPERITKFCEVIQRAGGRAVKVESSGVAHEWNRWIHLLSGNSFDRYCSVVTLIGDTEDFYSCGMHHFGLPDCCLPRSLGAGEAAALMNQFNMYQIVEKPTIESGNTFSLSKEALVFRLTLAEDSRHQKSHLFHNPHGIWHLAPLS